MEVWLFGRLAALAGSDKIVADAGLATGADVRDWLAAQMPHMAPDLFHASTRIAIDHQFAAWNDDVAAGQIVALMPPFSGG